MDVLSLVNFFTFLLALIGLAMLVHCLFQLDAALSFALSAGVVIVVLFVFGLVRLLFVGLMVVYVLGIGAFGFVLVQMARKKWDLAFFTSPSLAFFFAASVVLFFLYKDMVCYNPDEYSHWAMLVKEMLRFDALPDIRTGITYRDYPPGAALFLYASMRMTGFSEGMAHVYQGIFSVCALCGLFVGSSYRKPMALLVRLFLVAVVSSVFPLAYTSLLVDYLVGMYGMVLLVFVFWACTGSKEVVTIHYIGIAILASAVALIKTSAIAMTAAGLGLMLLLLLVKRRREKKLNIRRLLPVMCAVVLPLLTVGLWFLHVQLAYPGEGYAQNKFAITPDNLARGYSGKPQEYLDRLPGEFLRTLFTEPISMFFFFSLVVTLLVWLLVRFANRLWNKTLLAGAGISVVLWAGYNVSYYLMLRYLMPSWEMSGEGHLVLAFGRYESSVVGVITGFLLMAALLVWEEQKLFAGKWYGYLIPVAFALPFVPKLTVNNMRVPYDSVMYQEFIQVDSVYQEMPPVFDETTRLTFYIGDYYDNDSYFNNDVFRGKYLTRYVTNFSNTSLDGVKMEWVELAEELPALLRESDYLVVAVHDEMFYRLLADAGIDYDINDGILYQVSEDRDAAEVALMQMK